MVVNAGLWSILGSLFEKILMLATYVIVSREVTPVEFGYLVLVLLIIELMGYVAGFGVGENIIRKKVVSDLFMANSFYFVCYVSLALVVTMLVIVAPVSYLVSGDGLAILVLLMALYPALTTFSGFYLAILQRDMRFKEIAYRTVVISIISGMVGIALALSGAGVLSLVAARYAYSIIDLLILRHLTSFSPSARVDRKELLGIYDFGWKISAAQLLNFSSSRVYEIFVTALFGPAYLAMLDVGRKFIMTFYRIVLTPLNSVCLSYISKAEDAVKSYLMFATIVSLLVVPVVAIMGGVSDYIVLMFFGDQWAQAGFVLKVLSIGVIVQASTWFLPSLVISKGESGIVFAMNAIQVGVLITFGYFAYLALVDFERLIWLLLVGFFVSSLIKIIYLHIKINFPVLKLLLIVICAGVIYVSFYLLSGAVFEIVSDIFRGSCSKLLCLNIFGVAGVCVMYFGYLGCLFFLRLSCWNQYKGS